MAATSTGFSTNRQPSSRSVDNFGPIRALCGPSRGADGPPERSPDDVDDLVDVLVGISAFGGRPDAAADVVLEDEDRQRVDGRAQGGGLPEDVHAVLLTLDHPGDAPDLALHPRQSPDEESLVLGVAMPEVARVGGGRRWSRGGAHRSSGPRGRRRA